MPNLNIIIYIAIFVGGFLANKLLFSDRQGWRNKELDSTLTLVGLFTLVGIVLFLF